MAAREPAHPIEKRDLLHGDPPNKSRLLGVATQLADAGRWGEAVDYLEVLPDAGLLAKAEAEAVAKGSVWLLSQVERVGNRKADPAQWVKLSEAAAADERWREAVRALGLAGRTDESEALRAAKCPDFDPFKPLGK